MGFIVKQVYKLQYSTVQYSTSVQATVQAFRVPRC
jgi:hypothetical protein